MKDKNPELYEILKAVCERAVQAAEQVYTSGEGQKKKEYALHVAEAYLKAKGIALDLGIIDAYVEAAVKDMNDYGNPYEWEDVEFLDDAEVEPTDVKTEGGK